VRWCVHAHVHPHASSTCGADIFIKYTCKLSGKMLLSLQFLSSVLLLTSPGEALSPNCMPLMFVLTFSNLMLVLLDDLVLSENQEVACKQRTMNHCQTRFSAGSVTISRKPLPCSIMVDLPLKQFSTFWKLVENKIDMLINKANNC